MRLSLSACASCSLCADTCFLYLSRDRDPEYIPAYKVRNSLGVLYRKKGRVSREALAGMEKLLWKNCVLCGRCRCPLGIDMPAMLAFARGLLRTQGLDGMKNYHP